MRRSRLAAAGFWLAGFLAMTIAQEAAQAQQPSDAVLKLVKMRPSMANVEYDTPADPAAIAACKIENVINADKKVIGGAVRDGQGKLLRRLVDTNGDNKIDVWSYYQDGFEVYRDIDLDGDKVPDECRWLNAGGTRIASVAGKEFSRWKRISAEEASKVLVQALASGDAVLLESVMATADELTAAGLPKDFVDKVAAAASKRAEQVDALRPSLFGWDKQTIWNRFDGIYPRTIPADPAGGPSKDITLYENVTVIPASSASQQDASKMAFLQIPDVIQLGDTWKFVELPRAVDPSKPIVASVSGIRSMLFDKANNVEQRDVAMDAALKALADYDVKNAPLVQGGNKENVARYHVGRVPLLRGVVKAAKSADDQLTYNKQVVDSLVAALRTGLFQQGRKVLDDIVAEGGKLGSYTAYSLIDADFAIKNDEPGANVLGNQKKWMANLEKFLTDFPDSDEVPTVLYHLANANEYSAEEEIARKQYGKLAEGYAATEAGKKAAGALRRLDLEGKTLAIKGSGLGNEPVDTAQFAGKTVLVVFWAGWAPPVRQELPELVKIYEKHHARGLEIVGVNLDNERADLDAFIKEHQITWPQIFEPGGMESRLAIEYGIISLPTMFLLDADGKVINRNLRTAVDVDRQVEKVLTPKQAGVGTGNRN
jgi:thiol-disulfide isomerase/thioredoxin